MDNEIFRCEDRLDQVRMTELNSVGEEEHFGEAIDKVEGSEVVEGRADVEAVSTAEVPGLAGAWFVVDDDSIAGRTN